MSIVERIRNWYSNRRKEPATFSIQCDEAGITQAVNRQDGDEVIRLAWDRVINVFAYKLDLYANDEICFVVESTDLRIEVRESDEGYKNLIARMQSNIPGFPPESQWWETVALPPFATNWTQIYSREKGDVQQQG